MRVLKSRVWWSLEVAGWHLALTGASPCAVEGRDCDLYVQLGHGIDFDDRIARCVEGRRADKKDARAKRCLSIAVQVQKGELAPDDAAGLGSNAALVQRIKDGGLKTEDLKLERDAFPCDDVFADPFISAAAKSTKAWAGLVALEDVYYLLTSQLSKRPKPALTADAGDALRTLVATIAGRDLRTARTSADLKLAKGFCELETSLLGVSGTACKRVTTRFDLLEKQEAAAAKVKMAADDAKQRMCDSLRERQDSCNIRCMDRFGPDDPQADACFKRCDAAVLSAGCQ